MIKTDCFGYKRGTCMVLTDLVCGQRECSFYKTQEQFRRDAEKYGGNETEGKRPVSSKIMLTYNGKTQDLRQWEEETGIDQGVLYQRIFKRHWDIKKAMTTPVKRYKQ